MGPSLQLLEKAGCASASGSLSPPPPGPGWVRVGTPGSSQLLFLCLQNTPAQHCFVWRCQASGPHTGALVLPDRRQAGGGWAGERERRTAGALLQAHLLTFAAGSLTRFSSLSSLAISTSGPFWTSWPFFSWEKRPRGGESAVASAAGLGERALSSRGGGPAPVKALLA